MNLPFAIALASAVLCLYVAGHTWRAARMERWRDQRWFAAAALTAGLYAAVHTQSVLDLPLPLRLALARSGAALVALHLFAWMGFAERLLELPRTRLDRAISVALASCAAAAWVPEGVFRSGPVAVEHVPWLGATYYRLPPGPMAVVCFAVYLASGCRPISRLLAHARRHREARWYAASLLVVLGFGAYNGLISAQLTDGPLLLGVGFLLPIAVSALVQTDRLVRTAHDLDLLSSHLEQEVRERSRALMQARQSLDRSERLAAIGQLAAGVAHEVNNPATALQANLAYLKRNLEEGALAPDALECVEESLSSVQRIARIVRELRDSARAAANPAEVEPVAVARAVQAALAAARPQLERARLDVEVAPGLHVLGNEAYLVQVLTNLIANSAQAVAEGVAPRIEVRAERRGEQVRIEVRDHGLGMTPEVQARIFEPFFTTKPVGRGTGLGLAVSRGLVQAMGGTVEVESAPGQGTAMRLNLPATSALARPGSRSVAAHGPRGRLVLVDDDPEVRRALARELAQRFEVVSAEGVQDGLGKLLAGPAPDLVLCDLVMSDGGGARFFQLLAAAHPDLARKVVFITGGAIHPDDVRFLATQPQPVLMKPLKISHVLEAVARLAA